MKTDFDFAVAADIVTVSQYLADERNKHACQTVAAYIVVVVVDIDVVAADVERKFGDASGLVLVESLGEANP